MRFVLHFIVLLLPTFIDADCCYHTNLVFRIRYKPGTQDVDRLCKRLFASMVGGETCNSKSGTCDIICQIPVCGDGFKHDDRYYCGKGTCNVFGCNCDGGCMDGSAEKNFYGKLMAEGFGYHDSEKHFGWHILYGSFRNGKFYHKYIQ